MILTAQSITDYIKYSLGYGVIALELSEDQLSLCRERALQLYNRYRPLERRGSITLAVSATRYELTERGRGILEVQPPLASTPSYSDLDIFNLQSHVLDFGPSGAYEYALEQHHLEASKMAMGLNFGWEEVYEPTANKWYLFITPKPANTGTLTYIYAADHDFATIPPSDEGWIQDYALAMAKQVLSQIRGKFTTIQSSTASINLNAQSLAREAENSMSELKNQIMVNSRVLAMRQQN